MEELKWVLCPRCKGKTRLKIAEDTVIYHLPLFCPKCKSTTVVDINVRPEFHSRAD